MIITLRRSVNNLLLVSCEAEEVGGMPGWCPPIVQSNSHVHFTLQVGGVVAGTQPFYALPEPLLFLLLAPLSSLFAAQREGT